MTEKLGCDAFAISHFIIRVSFVLRHSSISCSHHFGFVGDCLADAGAELIFTR
jgi:hypothetical protein